MSDLAERAFAFVAVVVWFLFFFRLFRKARFSAGRSTLLAVGMCLPPINIFLAVYFVVIQWPIERELMGLRARAGIASSGNAETVLAAALKLETSGDAAAAVAKYREVLERFGDTEAARDAEASIRALERKVASL